MTLFCIKCKNVVMHKEIASQKKIKLYCKNCNEFYDTSQNRFHRKELIPNLKNKNCLTKEQELDSDSVDNDVNNNTDDLKIIERLSEDLQNEMKDYNYMCEDITYKIVRLPNESDYCENCGNNEFSQFQNKNKTHLSYFRNFYQCTTSTCRQIYQRKIINKD